jgi:Fur family ferric uptake transcriptional regulator
MKSNLVFTELLRTAGLKATTARISICEALSHERYPVSISALAKKVSSPNQSTLYRTLKNLVSKELVREIIADKKEARYEIAFGRKHHHHITCTGCGTIDDIDVCPPTLDAKHSSKKFARVTGHTLEFFGICKTCA